MKNMIEVNEFSFAYDRKLVLADISFKIKNQEIVGVLGANGSGKTTLLNSIYGLNGSSSQIQILNEIPSLYNDIVKSHVAYIQDNPNILDYLSGQEYLNYFKTIYGLSNLRNQDLIQQLIDTFNLTTDLNDKLIKSYSYGMKKKIQIIAELMIDKPLIIIDEPTNGLDIKSILGLKQILRLLNKKYQTTIMISTHNLSFMESLCQRVLIFDDTRLKKDFILEEKMNLERIYLSAVNSHETNFSD